MHFPRGKQLVSATSVSMEMVLHEELSDREFRLLAYIVLSRKHHYAVNCDDLDATVAELDQLWEHLYELGYMIDCED